MAPIDVAQLDITETNIAVRELIEVTENPRHRYLLEAYDRHRNLEHAGRVEEIFAAEMMVEHPVYRFDMAGQPPMVLEGRGQVEPLYRFWARRASRSSTTRARPWPSGTGWSSARWSATSRPSAPRSSRAGSRPRSTRCTSSGAGWR